MIIKKELPLPLYALIMLSLVASIFYLSYNFSNTLTANRADITEIFFEWENSIPFLAWTIIPYWSLNAFYALAFFICRTRHELHHLVKQLLIAQIIAITCFIFFPLQFSWDKPNTDGVFEIFFSSLADFDKPYNQAPSLHIILSVILGTFYWHIIGFNKFGKFTNFIRAIWIIWVLLIAISVLTTYQHHFVDIPTGLLTGLIIIWILPHPNIKLPISYKSLHQNQYRKWIVFYCGASIFFILLTWGLASRSAYWLWLLYPATSSIIVAIIYFFKKPELFQKQKNGKLSFAVTLLLLPYIIAVRINIWLWLRGKKKSHVIMQNENSSISVGSICTASHFAQVFDLCAEYPYLACRNQEKKYADYEKSYHSFPALDMISPTPTLLFHTAKNIEKCYKQGSDILVCCALGYGRSVAAILTWLVTYGHSSNLDEAIKLVKATHPNMVISQTTKADIITATLHNPL